MSNVKTITIKVSHSYFYLAGAVVIAACLALGFFYVRAAFIEPTFAPGDSNQDFAQNILGANNANNLFDSSLVTASGTGSIIERMQYIQENLYPYGDNDAWYVLGTADAPGKAMKDTWSGSSTTYVYPQSVGGVDDCNYTGSACGSYPTESYGSFTPWTQCTAANYYCGTSATTTCSGDVCWRDDSTGLVWSDQISSSIDWFAANNCEDDALRGDGTCSTHGEENCQCFKKTSSKTGCEGLADAGWRLPDQKEWMLGYVNGMQNHIPNTSSGSTFYYFWSATTRSNYTFLAWVVYPALGFVTNFNKTSNYRARCVR